MDCKEMIELLQKYPEKLIAAYTLDGKFASACHQAAAVIETLLAERDAAFMYVPRNCTTCKWWKEIAQSQCVAVCMHPKNSGGCRFDEPNLWELRSLTHTDAPVDGVLRRAVSDI